MIDLDESNNTDIYPSIEQSSDFENKSEDFNYETDENALASSKGSGLQNLSAFSENQMKKVPEEREGSYLDNLQNGHGVNRLGSINQRRGNSLCYESNGWLDRMFTDRWKRLSRNGVSSAQDYVRFLAEVDDAMEKNPQFVIKKMCEAYGVDVPQMSKQTCERQVREFQSERDKNGYLKYPYFPVLREQMADLLQKGMADDLSGAYQQAAWLNPDTRSHMIGHFMNNELNRKAAAAQKAREASFSPHSKSVSDGTEKTLRQEIEEIYYNLL